MYDSPAVRVAQCVRKLHAVTLHLIEPHADRGNFYGQRPAFHVLHRDVRLAVDFADFINSADVRVIQGGDGARFLQHIFMAGGAAGGKDSQEFQRDVALEFFVTGAIHHAHATFAELLFN